MKYKKPYLSKVILRLDFDAPVFTPVVNISKTHAESLQARFPKAEPSEVTHTEYRIFPEKEKLSASETAETHLRFYGSDRKKILVLAPDFITLEYTQYDTFPSLLLDYDIVHTILLQLNPDVQTKRLGLRYINHIDLDEADPTKWDEYLKPELLSIFRVPEDPLTISRAFHVLVTNYGDYYVTFQYGAFNPDFPALLKRKQFTLDYDAVCEEHLPLTRIANLLDSYHIKIEYLFENNITDALRAKMEVVADHAQ